jgi:hypothetical protein
MLGFVKDYLKEEIEKMEKLEKEEELENRKEYGNLVEAKLLVERDIKTLNIIFDLLIQIELEKSKAQNKEENNTNIDVYDSNEESDDVGFR